MVPALLAGAGLLGKIFGGGAKGASDQRMGDNQQILLQNQQTQNAHNTKQQALLQALLGQSQQDTSRYNTKQGATTTALGQEEAGKMNRAQLGLQAPNVRARQSILGSLMKNMQPVSVQAQGQVAGKVPQISGGLTPAALDPTTRQHGDELMKAALMAQMSGSDVPEATNFAGGVLDAPQATDFRSGILDSPELAPLKQSGKLEKILGAIGLIGSSAGALGGLIKPKPEDEAGMYGGG